MAFRRRAPEPYWHKKRREAEEIKKADEMQEKVGTIFDFSEEEIELMRKCICPRVNCPVHPGENLSHLVDPKPKRR